MTESHKAAQAGLDPILVDSLRVLRLLNPDEIDLRCAMGAAWVAGRRSVPPSHTWEAVASLPSTFPLPERLLRTTAETLIGLANKAQTRFRLAAPYMDDQGLGYLADSIVAATLRCVSVELIEPADNHRATSSIAHLHRSIQQRGAPQHFRLLNATEGAPFPHLKVMTVDGLVAYVGSANLTAAALGGRNLELGVLVNGASVQVIDEFLDTYT